MNKRYAFLDVYRGIVVLLMIEGHAMREFLQPSLQLSPVFRFHELLHGITGPGFLFGAGITFGISAERRWADFLRPTRVLGRRLRKIVLLLLLGYGLHLPFFSLSKTLAEASPRDWQAFLSFDVLQCIGYSLLILQILLLVLRERRLFLGTVIVLGSALVLVAPVVWRMDLSDMSLALSAGLQGAHGSVYPLVPYGAFLFAGAAVSYEFTRHAKEGTDHVFIRRLTLAGFSCIAGGFVFEEIPLHLYAETDFWHDSPNFFLMKLGGLFLLMSGAWLLERRFRAGTVAPLALLGVESLFVYIVHLVALYGSPVNAGTHLSFFWEGKLGWMSATVLSAVFVLVLYALARFRRVLKEEHPVLLQTTQWWLGFVLVYEFLTRLY